MRNFKVINCGSPGNGVMTFTKSLLKEMNINDPLSEDQDWYHRYYYTNNSRVEMVNVSSYPGFIGPTFAAFRNADHINIVVDVTQKNFSQSLLILKTALKISSGRVTVLLNKMDLVLWDKDVYQELCGKIRSHIVDEDQLRVQFVPTSSKTGGNVYHLEPESQWFSGDSAYQTWKRSFLHQKRSIEPSSAILALSKGQWVDDQWFVHGSVVQGKVKSGDSLFSLPARKPVEIKKLYILDKAVSEAKKGSPITIQLDQAMDPHFLVKENLDFQTADRVTARIYNWKGKFEKEQNFKMKYFSREFQCKVHNIHMENRIGEDVWECVVDFKVFPKLTYQRIGTHKRLGTFYIIDPISQKNCGIGLF